MQKYPSGSRGSPAKGVVWDNRSAGSNPAFCARTKKGLRLNAISLSPFFAYKKPVRYSAAEKLIFFTQ